MVHPRTVDNASQLSKPPPGFTAFRRSWRAGKKKTTKGAALARCKNIRPSGFGSPRPKRRVPPKKLRSKFFPLATPDFASQAGLHFPMQTHPNLKTRHSPTFSPCFRLLETSASNSPLQGWILLKNAPCRLTLQQNKKSRTHFAPVESTSTGLSSGKGKFHAPRTFNSNSSRHHCDAASHHSRRHNKLSMTH